MFKNIKKQQEYKIRRLLKEIKSKQDDKSYLWHLRQGLIEEREYYSYPYLEGFDFKKDPAICFIAGFAAECAENILILEENNPSIYFGKSCQQLQEKGDALEQRFMRLLSCDDLNSLKMQLRSFWLPKFKKTEILIDFVQLYLDLKYWDNYDSRLIKRRFWATGFFNSSTESEKGENETDTFTNSN